ncbi:hypothetical protein Tco_0400379 [Tanacetum coccineum]
MMLHPKKSRFDLEDILQIQDVILREKLLNISRLITNIESLNDNPTPDHEFKSPSSFPIPVTDSDSFFENSDTFLSYSDNSLPNFELLAMIRKRREVAGELTNVVIEEVDTFLVPEDSIPPGIESNFDPRGGEIDFSQNVKDDDSFTFVIRTFLSFLTNPVDSPLLLSTGSDRLHFCPMYLHLESVASHQGWIARILKTLSGSWFCHISLHSSFISSASIRESDILILSINVYL